MIRQFWALSVHTRAFLRRYMPTKTSSSTPSAPAKA